MNSFKAKATGIFTAVVLVVGAMFLFSAPTQAVDVIQCNGAAANYEICKAKGDKLFGPGSIWNNILNLLLFIIGAIAVLMIIIGGMRYALSNGDQAQVAASKNVIVYAIVGLVLALSAGGIVNFVLTNI